PREKVVYLVDSEHKETEITQKYEPKLQPDDVLSIIGNSNSPDLAAKFNPGLVSFQNTSEKGSGVQRLQSYLIDSDGYIVFPVIGTIKVGGLTTTEAVVVLTVALKPNFVHATINLSLMNFQVTVHIDVVLM